MTEPALPLLASPRLRQREQLGQSMREALTLGVSFRISGNTVDITAPAELPAAINEITPSDTATYSRQPTPILSRYVRCSRGSTDMLRISQRAAEDEGGATYLRLEGRVAGPWVEELRRVCTEISGNNGHRQSLLVIDLIGVSFLDADGIALFHELAARRVRFTNCSSFVAEQLRGVADVDS